MTLWATPAAQLQDLLDGANSGDRLRRKALIGLVQRHLTGLTRRCFDRDVLGAGPDSQPMRRLASSLKRTIRQDHPATVREFFGLAARHVRQTLIDLADDCCPSSTGLHSDTSSSSGQDTAVAVSNRPVTAAEWQLFHAAVDGLPDSEHEVFCLVWYAGLSENSVAEALSLSEAAVRQRLQSARLRLASILEEVRST